MAIYARTLLVIGLCLVQSTSGFAPRAAIRGKARLMAPCRAEAEATADAEPAEAPQTPPIPDELPSAVGYDHMPLAEALSKLDFKEADQITRDSLIQLAGEAAQERNYVYWTEVKKIPEEDMETMERLWLLYSEGKFGYSVQRKVWRQQKGDFENFCRKINWNTKDGEIERKRKWFGAGEYLYTMDAPRAHLPLTAALRGTPLLKNLLEHPTIVKIDEETKKSKKK